MPRLNEPLHRKTPDNPFKVKARAAVSAAVRRGDLTPAPCEMCGGEPTQAHHDDYTKPLAVRWLCAGCHSWLHSQASALTEYERRHPWER